MAAAAESGGGGGGIDFRKRRGGVLSSSERITGAKNAQADMILQRLLLQFQQELRRLNNQQQGTSYVVEHELKLLHLDRKCSELSEHRRLYPDADHSHEESTIRNLRRFLVQTTGVTSYTDKRLTHKLRTQAQPDSKTPVVARAQAKLRLQAFERALQAQLDAAATAGDSGDADGSPSRTNRKRAAGGGKVEPDLSDSDDDGGDEEEDYNGAAGNRHAGGRALGVADKRAAPTAAAPSGGGGGGGGRTLPQRALSHDPAASRRPARLPSDSLSEPVERRQAATTAAAGRSDPATPCAAVATAGRPPLTQAAMRECLHRVNKQVIEFCEYIDSKVWDRKEEDFQQALRYVKDKEKAWTAFMDDLQKRQKVRLARLDEMKEEESLAAAERQRQLGAGSAASVRRKPISAATKKRLLLENILPARAGSAPADGGAAAPPPPSPPGGGKRQRGMPWHAAERSNKHSPSMKLKMIIDRARGTAAAAAAAAATAQSKAGGDAGPSAVVSAA